METMSSDEILSKSILFRLMIWIQCSLQLACRLEGSGETAGHAFLEKVNLQNIKCTFGTWG